MQELWFYLSLIGYYAIHSLLASGSFKRYLGVEKTAQFRLMYNVIAVVTLAPVICLYLETRHMFRNEPGVWIKLLGYMAIALGLFILRRAFLYYDLKIFLGISSKTYSHHQSELVTRGLLK